MLSLALVVTICASKKVPKGMTKADKDFLRAVEKQFELYGNTLKIQVKSDNATEAGSEPTKGKRTVGGHYGYGYNNGAGNRNHYQFSAPKFEVYPYSQHDILPVPHHSNAHQHGFNLQQSHGHGYSSHQQLQHFGQQQHRPQHHQHQQQHGDDQHAVPVIVLRVPGPPAYAAHLQALLQAYILSRTEQLRQQHRALTHSYGTPLAHPLSNYEPAEKHQYEEYQVQNVQQSNQVHEQHEIQHPVQQAPQYLPPVQEEQQEQVQHHHQHQHQEEQQSYEEPSAEYGAPEQQVQYEHQEEQYVQQEPHHQHESHHQPETHHQQEHVQYVRPQQNYALQYVVQQQEQEAQPHYHPGNLPTNENYPSESHTRVIFPTNQQYQATRPQYAYQQQDLTKNYEEPPASPEAQQRENQYLPHVGGEKGPYNYHAHNTRNAQVPERHYSREQSRKYNQLIAKLRRGINSKPQ